MSDDPRQGQDIPEVGFEREDLSARNVFSFLITLGVLAVVIHFVLNGFYYYMNSYEHSHHPAVSPLATNVPADTRMVTPADVTKFPQPRLETDERSEINSFRLYEEQRLHSYGWVDKNAGVVHIPIDRAMQLLAQRGLPTRAVNPGAEQEGQLEGKQYAPGPVSPVQRLPKPQPSTPPKP